MTKHIAPGDFVRNPAMADWGLGQVQSKIEDRVTVNFENQGKVLINIDFAMLALAEEEAQRE